LRFPVALQSKREGRICTQKGKKRWGTGTARGSKAPVNRVTGASDKKKIEKQTSVGMNYPLLSNEICNVSFFLEAIALGTCQPSGAAFIFCCDQE
jgi:hypothetical protein